jgi:hypothetical protein
MLRFLVGEARGVAGAPRMPRSCLFRPSIRSLIEAARFSCSGERSNRFIGAVNIQSGSKARIWFVFSRHGVFSLIGCTFHLPAGGNAVPQPVCIYIIFAARVSKSASDFFSEDDPLIRNGKHLAETGVDKASGIVVALSSFFARFCQRPSASDGLKRSREHGQGIRVLPWMSLPV